MDYYRNKYMNEKGITLIALAITIVVLLILAGITIATLTGDNGIITQAQKAKDETDKAYYKEQLELASLKYINGEIKFEDILNTEDFKFEEYFNGSKSKVIKTKEGFYFTILEDGTVLEGKLAYLDIADGSIDIKSTGFIQGTLTAKTAYHMNGEFIPYEGDYIITGETKENAVRIWEQGTYNITIKNLKIDLAELGGTQALCAFNGNCGQSATGVYVNLKLEENNYLCGYSAPGLGFGRATPNVNGVTNGSTLIIEGEGRLEAIGTGIASGIGSGYTGWDSAAGDANNIIINSGNIVATAGTNACAIGSSLRQNVNNLIINGGNIIANASNRRKNIYRNCTNNSI